MRKEYIEPEIELVKFAIADIISTSDPDEGPILPPDDDETSDTTDPTGPVVPTPGENEGPIV